MTQPSQPLTSSELSQVGGIGQEGGGEGDQKGGWWGWEGRGEKRTGGMVDERRGGKGGKVR